MKIAHVTFYYDENLTNEEDFLKQHYTVTGWAEALQQQGAEVHVISRFTKENHFQKNNIAYHFVNDGLGPQLRNRHLPLTFFKRIKELNADIIHLHHLSLCVQTFWLRFLLNRKTAIVIQHHGGPLPGRKKRMMYNLFNSVADGYFFSTIEQGKEWFMKKNHFDKIFPVMEGATFFNYEERNNSKGLVYYDRDTARKKTGMKGAPVFLWVGRLDNNKDPLTVLGGFEIFLQKEINATFYMVYSENKLSDAVEKKITGSAILRNSVHLLGKIPHNEIEMYYNSADYFVLGSHYEGSGYALSEALRCGCVPIVTNIPSFTMMTNGGQLGALWESGNKHSFVKAIALALDKPLQEQANACITFFTEYLSYDAIAKSAIVHYQKMIDRRLKN